jgi:hypothetical protein
MTRVLAWAAPAVIALAAGGVLAFRYYMLPFDSTAPEDLIKVELHAAPSLADISDPVERARAERGKYIVGITGCDGCHHTPGRRGPLRGMYMAGGAKFLVADDTTVVTRNLTSDAGTGLGNVTDEDVLRVLRSGVTHDGRTVFYRAMPWAAYSNWTEEDRRAVLTYLRHLKPVAHRVPDLLPTAEFTDEDAREERYFGADYGATATR